MASQKTAVRMISMSRITYYLLGGISPSYGVSRFSFRPLVNSNKFALPSCLTPELVFSFALWDE